jgi:UDP-glucose 4-epimerase
VNALEFAVDHEIPGVYNAAPDGVLAFSEVIDLIGKHALPILPPWGTGLARSGLKRLGFQIPPEMLIQMRYGRGLDNRKLKAAGFKFKHSTRETVMKFGEHLRLRSVLRGVKEPYRYEKEVEDFLRWSPSVRERSMEDRPPRYFPPAPAGAVQNPATPRR